MEVFALRTSRGPWGDYGNILAHGMSARRSRVGGRIQLERTGPFVPPICLPGIGDVVVTNDARLELEHQGFTGLSFAPVDKCHIVRSDWHTWDRSASEPPIYPASRAPEDFILGEPHDEATSRAIGPLWEVVLVEHGQRSSEATSIHPRKPIFTLAFDTPPPAFFHARGMRTIFVNGFARTWIEKCAGQFVWFEPVLLGQIQN
jgi:hypothetical protein